MEIENEKKIAAILRIAVAICLLMTIFILTPAQAQPEPAQKKDAAYWDMVLAGLERAKQQNAIYEAKLQDYLNCTLEEWKKDRSWEGDC